MKTINLRSNEVGYYKLDIPDENYTKVVELIEKKNRFNGIDTDAIKRYPVQSPIRKYFSEELQSLCECDITDEDYRLMTIPFYLTPDDV